LIREVRLGGEAAMTFDSSQSKTASSEDFKLAARAAYQGLGGGASATASHSTSQKSASDVQVGQSKLLVRGGSANARQALVSQPNPANWGKWAAAIPENLEMLAPGPQSFMPVWDLTDDAKRSSELRAAFNREVARHPRVVQFADTSERSGRSDGQVTVPRDYKLLSGGALIEQGGAGSLLTASYPENPQTWRVLGKEHVHVNPASATAYALALHDPENIWEVRIFQNTGGRGNLPSAEVTVPGDYVMVGGGAKVDWQGAGNLLTSSWPKGPATWAASSKSHVIEDPAAITVYAIGLKSKLPAGSVTYRVDVVTSTSQRVENPTARASADVMVGGGARVDWSGAGSLLTASYPQTHSTWGAISKNHHIVSPATITSYALGLSVER
jgi:hypothetical protein